MRKLHSLLARCHQMLEDIPSVLNACAAAVRLDPDDTGLHFRKAILHRVLCRALDPGAAHGDNVPLFWVHPPPRGWARLSLHPVQEDRS